ncbi:DEAD/DEAH box helicase [Aquabacter spiritensis]|uniref:DEAD-box ATP-dependent RNA helicase RhpA n=1 Tax=Aquabacter spiritensis TaxID=933073 RepID=A0A4R3LMK2_9HYPH|nr:DEAD/DEAH box helicase [Aquabacter spiritensis]TCT01542.1 superfamily II DNA/RNA helicase [Aquabacter spiritensis]
MSFTELGLSEKVLSAVAATGYTQPTPIQAQAIPHVLARRDVLGLAQTGTGKTAAFTLPMLTLLEQGRARARMPRTLILEPTRELAAQVEENFVRYGKNHKLNVALLIGGVSFGDQDSKLLRGVDVLIATPGRLLDHVERGRLLLSGIEVLVIDEADRMLDMGFIPDIERVCKLVPFTRQTLFFSATMPPEIQRLVSQFLSNPVRVEVSKPASTAATVTQILVGSGSEDYEKRDVLRELMRTVEGLQNAIVFCNRKREVSVLHRSLQKHGFNAVCLHGDMDQHSRTQALDQFRSGEAAILVASDVAARGLDIPAVSHVFNYDVPHHAEDYVHRIGRTGRAGRAGAAISIVTHEDAKSLAAIEKLIGNAIPWSGEPLGEAPPRRRREEKRDGRTDKHRASGRGKERERSERNRPERSERPERPERDRRERPERERTPEKTAEPAEARAPRAPRPPREPGRESGRESGRDVAREPAAQPAARTASRPPRREHDRGAAEPADMSHLPAFLLRPVRVKAG